MGAIVHIQNRREVRGRMAIARTHRSILRRASDVLILVGVVTLLLIILGSLSATPVASDGGGCTDAQARSVTGSGDEVTYDASPNIVTGVCIKTGAGEEPGEPLHTGPLDNDTHFGCYAVSGVGTTSVTVERTGDPGPECQSISHIDVYYAAPTPTPPPPPACPIQPNGDRIIIDLPDTWNLRSTAPTTLGPFDQFSPIPPGFYDVTLASYDDHSSKPSQVQPNEQWYLEGRDSGNNSVFASSAIDDLPDDQDYLVQTVSPPEDLGQAVTQLFAHHAFPGASSVNSIRPICAAFDPIPHDPGSITVIKSDANDALPGDWTFTINPDPNQAGSIGSGQTFADLAPGTYVITEFGPQGWVFESVDCGDESHPTTVILGPNEEAVCTYTNIFDTGPTPTPTATPTPRPEVGNIAACADGLNPLVAGGQSLTPSVEGEWLTLVGFAPGTYTVTSGSRSASVTVVAGTTQAPSEADWGECTGAPTPVPTATVLGVVVLPGTGFGPPSPVTLSPRAGRSPASSAAALLPSP